MIETENQEDFPIYSSNNVSVEILGDSTFDTSVGHINESSENVWKGEFDGEYSEDGPLMKAMGLPISFYPVEKVR